MNGLQVLLGDCRESLRSLPAESVHTCVTSPPYFGLRDYGVDGQIGLEATPDAYVDEMVAVFREVRRTGWSGPDRMTHVLSSTDRRTKPREIYVVDIETYPNVFLVGIKRLRDGYIRIFEQSHRESIDYKLLCDLLLSATIVTFNGTAFDIPILFFAIQGKEAVELRDGDPVYVTRPPTCAEIKAAANKLINGNVRPWQAAEALDAFIPARLDHVDLIDPQPNAFASLKLLNGRMHGRWMQELPYHHESVLDDEQIDRLREYLHNDLAATESLWNILQEPIALREYLGRAYDRDFRSMSDPQVGENMMRIGVQRRTGARYLRKKNVDQGTTFRYPRPAWAQFKTPAFQQFLDDVCATTFTLDRKLKVVKPDVLAERLITLGETTYSLGIGGIHSTESNRCLRSDHDYVYVDADVASQYPKAILSLGLYPESLGPAFLEEYDALRVSRLDAKRAKDKVRDKGMKIALNGVYGKLGSPFSIVFAPHLMCGVTLSCQLSILLLVERLEAAGYAVVSANTDGVLIRCPRPRYAGLEEKDGKPTGRLNPCELNDIILGWERDTTFELEFGEYRAIYNLSVNSYFAIKPNGGHKRKGPIGNPWSLHPDDFDPVRGQLMKNPDATICSDAALALIKHGIPVSETIRACRDVRQFVSVVTVNGGATWRGQYLGKVVRYYWGHDGDEILRAEPNEQGTHAKVGGTDGSRPCMTFLPSDDPDMPWLLPDDIDYARYEAETEKILTDYGFYGRPRPPLRFGRLTDAKREAMEPWLVLA